MLKLFLSTLLLVAFSMAFLAVKIWVRKGGRFPNLHIGGSAAMRRRGITCVQSMDFAERQPNPHRIAERRAERQEASSSSDIH